MTGPISRRGVLAGALTTSVGTLVTQPTIDAFAATAPAGAKVRFTAFEGANFTKGSFSGSQLLSGSVRFAAKPAGAFHFTDPHLRTTHYYDTASWTSGWFSVGFAATQAIASWDAVTPHGTWVEIAIQGRTATGATSAWYVMGRWASGDSASSDIRRSSVDGQSDAYALVETDTLALRSGKSFTGFRIQLRLRRLHGTTATPTVQLAGLMASALPASTPAVSHSGPGNGVTLAVPTYSQMLHMNEYPQWNGGGEAWCSATSTAMILDFWKKGPSASELAWVKAGITNPQVDHSARMTYDYTYGGTGNWPFNAAYAASRGLRAYATRLRSFAEAGQFIAAGVPLAISVTFSKAQLPQAGYGTAGHLMVLVGFTATGDPVVNDPASHMVGSNARVRNVYPRAALEAAWLGHSGGLVYVMAPRGHALPRPNAVQPNWA